MSGSQGLQRNTSKRSSFFSKHRQSFVRSGGDRGATVELLRGTKGADFEAEVQVQRGGAGVACGCFGVGSAGEFKTRYVVIKGPFCFVFKSEEASSPSYAIQLLHLMPECEKESKTVALREMGDCRYTLTFDTADKATEFASVVRHQAARAESEEVRKNLGHTHLLNKRSSAKFTEAVACQKTKDQPDAPITTGEILSNMQMAAAPL